MSLNILQPRHLVPKLFLVVFLIACAICSVAQTDVVVAIAPVKMNVFYIGVDNPVTIAASNVSDEKVTVSINGGNGSVSKAGAGNYIVRVSQSTDDCTIQVQVDGKPAGTSKFRVRALPPPIATIGGNLSGSNVSAGAFRDQGGVGLFIKDFPFEVKYEVVSYTLTIDDDKGGIKTVDSQDAAFSTEIKQFMQENVKPGKTITVDNIKARGPEGISYCLSCS